MESVKGRNSSVKEPVGASSDYDLVFGPKRALRPPCGEKRRSGRCSNRRAATWSLPPWTDMPATVPAQAEVGGSPRPPALPPRGNEPTEANRKCGASAPAPASPRRRAPAGWVCFRHPSSSCSSVPLCLPCSNDRVTGRPRLTRWPAAQRLQSRQSQASRGPHPAEAAGLTEWQLAVTAPMLLVLPNAVAHSPTSRDLRLPIPVSKYVVFELTLTVSPLGLGTVVEVVLLPGKLRDEVPSQALFRAAPHRTTRAPFNARGSPVTYAA
jgi:hypothetical protein